MPPTPPLPDVGVAVGTAVVGFVVVVGVVVVAVVVVVVACGNPNHRCKCIRQAQYKLLFFALTGDVGWSMGIWYHKDGWGTHG